MVEKLPRVCDSCGEQFRPMSDALWQHVKFEHDLMSLRHESRQGNIWTRLEATVNDG